MAVKTELEEFNEYLNYLVELPVFITDSVNDLDTEIRDNCCHIGITEEVIPYVQPETLITFLDIVKKSRKKALQHSGLDIDLIYYIWHDQQAGQLRFNFINSNHLHLPFGAEVILADDEKAIVENYLNNKLYHEKPFRVLVFKELISKNI